MEMICENNVCRTAHGLYDFDLIIMRDMLQHTIDNEVVNGWTRIDLAVEEVQMFLRLVKQELESGELHSEQ